MTETYLITGPAGSGKTTLGLALADRCGGVSLDLDDVSMELVFAYRRAHPDRTEAQALADVRTARYSLLAEQARAVIAGSAPSTLVLIAPFTKEISSPTLWAEWLAALGLTDEHVHLVWLTISAEERLRRLESRGESRDAELVATGSVPEPPAPAVPALAVSAALPVAEQVELVVQRFGNA